MLTLSHSKIESFARCPQYYEYSYLEGLISVKEQVSLLFGDAYHQGYGVLYDNLGIEAAVAKFKKAFEPYEGKDPKGLRTLAKGEEMLRAYDEQFIGKEQW